MRQRPPISTRTDPLFPHDALPILAGSRPRGASKALWAQSPFGWPFMRKSACSARLRHFGRESMTRTVDEIMELAPVIPVLVIERVEDAQPIAQALVAGGLPALDVTMRTPVALQVKPGNQSTRVRVSQTL